MAVRLIKTDIEKLQNKNEVTDIIETLRREVLR